jgi:hypothetical protein
MWILALLLFCIVLSLAVRYAKSKPGQKEPAEEAIFEPDQPLLDAAEAPHHKEHERPSELLAAMTPFSLNVTPRPESMRDAVMTDAYGQVHISVQHQTCSCNKFAERAGRPMNNVGRWCRHLVNIMSARRAMDHENEWIKAIIEDGYDGPLYAFMVDRPTTGKILMTGGANTEWLNFYAHNQKRGQTIAQASGKINRYGWSIERKGWAYGKPPPGARELRRLIESVNKITIQK